MQNETLANGENSQWPRIYLDGSCLHPNIAAKMHRYIPNKKNTLLSELYKACWKVDQSYPVWNGTMIQIVP